MDMLILCIDCKAFEHEFDPRDDNGDVASLGIELYSFSGERKYPLSLETNMIYIVSKI